MAALVGLGGYLAAFVVPFLISRQLDADTASTRFTTMTDPTGLTFGRVGLLGPALSSHCCGWNDLVEPYIVARWTCVLVTGDLAGRGDEVTTPAWGGVSRSVVVRAPWPARGPMVP